ncbi:MAG: helix-turn-helix domain-containing protein [Planctomycetes bacterium]|nr:helix-turn-helix domain-containing protein [Planctomycetota bacterium]
MTELGQAVRERRRQVGWTLDRLAAAAGCSKAYLSGIENARHANPPSARLVEAIESALSITPGELRRLADWQSTPLTVREDYQRMAAMLDRRIDGSLNLDALYQSGALQRSVEASAGNVEPMRGVCVQVPLINKVAAGYPRDFTDLDYPARVADEYVSCGQINDPDVFAARVVGESMQPTYREGDIIVFSPAIEPYEGADCFVRLLPDHDTTFKRVYFESEDRVRLQPLNPAFGPRVVALDQIAGLYPALFRIQRLGKP